MAVSAKASETQTVFPPNLMEAQERNATLLARANEVMASTARTMWESEMEFLWFESEQVAKGLVPLKLGDDPTATVSACCEQWQDGSERLLNHMRNINDLVRKCGWDLFHIYRDSLREAAESCQPLSRQSA